MTRSTPAHARVVLAVSFMAFAATPALAAHVEATYTFAGTFAALEPTAPAATPFDPLATSSFGTAIVYGASRPVWNFAGAGDPTSDQAGLTVDTTGLLSPRSYSAELVFKFNENTDQWRRILDVQNRQSDNGFYVDPTNNLALFPVAGSSNAFTTAAFHHVVLTTDGTTVQSYLDGVPEFAATSDLMNLDFDPANNPARLLGVFIDNVALGGLFEWSSGSIALLRLHEGVLTAPEVAALARDPFASIPEPAALSFLAPAALLTARRRR